MARAFARLDMCKFDFQYIFIYKILVSYICDNIVNLNIFGLLYIKINLQNTLMIYFERRYEV